MPRRSSFVLALVVTVAGTAAPAGAGAQADQFGGFELLARGNGLQVTYDSPGFVPQGPALQVSIPEALATSSSGTNYSLASLAYPGPVLADLSTVLAQSNPDLPAVVPPYPVRTQAFYPSGPTAQAQSGGSAEMRSVTDAESSQASAVYSGTDVGPLIQSGSIKSSSATRVESGKVTSRARVELTGLGLLGGLIHIDSVVTDLVAVSDGRRSSSDGRTTVSGVTFLGLAATLDKDGLKLVEQPPTTGAPGPLDPVLNPLLGSATLPPGATDAAKPLLDNLNSVLSKLGPDATVTKALKEAGVTVRVLEPVATSDKGTATRSAYGIQLDLEYSASGDPRVAPLLSALVPPGSLPRDCLVPGAPVDCSPEGLVSLLQRTHILNLALAPADVRAAATAPFEPFEESFSPPAALAPGQGVDLPIGSTADLPAPGFSTPAPVLSPPSSGGLGEVLPLSALGRALPAVLVVLLLLSAPLWAAASRRLADGALAEGASGCPDGLDARQRPPGRRR